MIIHVVAFRWKPGMPAGHVEEVQAQLKEFAATLPGVLSYRCGPDEGASDMGNFDFAIVAEFESIDDWRVYDKHPRHNEIRAGVVRPWIEERAAVQFEG
ncbi:MAG TPA: Dabb family protein [Ilumatobacteraceae bacterium]|jgi:Stress responsive A/B Barrel Domain|nr:Dabb family protein [Ilumatobacteraceae bacterium]